MPKVPASTASGERPQSTQSDLEAAERLRAAILKLGRRLRTIDLGTGLTPAEFSALATVVRRGPISPTELAQVEGVNPTMLSRMLSRMSAVGAVSRDVAEGDRRVALVAATASGRRLHQRLRVVRAGKLQAALCRLPPSEHDAVLEALPGLEALADQLKQEAL
ncbi:MAG TPA: MarR family transcriptional regulator [Candidatus Dormibacteraeota bacterium]|nr:MarR family transcriptional regulator [Candidatus Dormibacteraeota bacterium]